MSAPMATDASLRAYAWNLSYARQLASDLTEEQWTLVPGPGHENHPTWTLGHLVTASDMLAKQFGLERDVSSEWNELFERRGPGDPRLPNSDPAAYPPLPDVLQELERQHERVDTAWRGAQLEHLQTPIRWRFHETLPTRMELALFMAVSHESMHLGQVAAWRRAVGLPSALAAL